MVKRLDVVTSDALPVSHSEPVSAEPLTVLLATPRGFCAGVVRAIRAVEDALAAYGPPIYVRRAIVHNLTVVRALEKQGAIFVSELDEVPAGSRVILSAHGVATTVVEEGRQLGLSMIDAICPLVQKVHRGVRRHHERGRHILLIGHAGHPEILGSLGQIPDDGATLIQTPADVAALDLPRDCPVAYAVQTTFAVEEAQAVIAAINARFSDVAGPSSSDICYATTNRQQAVRAIAPLVDAILVAGESFSSNANRLVEVARLAGCRSQLVPTAEGIDWSQLEGARSIGVTSAASTPDVVVQNILDRLRKQFRIRLQEVGSSEDVTPFKPVLV